ncbi:MAG: MarR family transcriptional regulator [Rhizobiales bacterium PAR1]|nr:MAG: MarR family transcriptional regulator [Rhizobiales bacterium PAR1]
MDVYRMAGHLIRRLHQHSTQAFSTRMQALGLDLTPVQFAAMSAIAATPGIDQARVAAEIGYDRATIGGVIDRLEHKGTIARTVSRLDRRAREVRLTEKGEALLEATRPVVIALQAEILAGLSETERAIFLDLAGKAIGLTVDQSPASAT